MTFKRWVVIATFLFIAGLGWGLTVPIDASGPLDENVSSLKRLADFLLSQPQALMFVFIYLKNVTAVLVSFALSPFFLLMPVAALVLNGGLIGLVGSAVAQQKSVLFVLAGTLPHGIFELPALIIGEAAALSFGTAAMLSLFSREKRAKLAANFKQNLKYLGLSFILLLPAALIETYVTPLLVK